MRHIAILLLLFALAAPAVMQEATPEAPTTIVVESGGTVNVTETPAETNGELVAILITVVLLAVLATVAYLGRPLILAAAQSAPPVLVDAVLAALDAVLARLQDVVAKTPSTLDDEALAALRREMEAIRQQLENPPVPKWMTQAGSSDAISKKGTPPTP